jgi:8-oxo-dGTP diphosphatase
MDIKDGAKVFIKNEKLGKYLFFLRDNKPTIPNPNMYGLLGGGIEVGEEPIEALEREMQEESNIDIHDIQELGNKTVTHMIRDGKGEQTAVAKIYFFLAQTEATLKDAELHEGQKLEYFTIEEALTLDNLSPAIREAINEYRDLLV